MPTEMMYNLFILVKYGRYEDNVILITWLRCSAGEAKIWKDNIIVRKFVARRKSLVE